MAYKSLIDILFTQKVIIDIEITADKVPIIIILILPFFIKSFELIFILRKNEEKKQIKTIKEVR
jgi:hypothetical protein